MRIRSVVVSLVLCVVAACQPAPRPEPAAARAPVPVRLIAINDLHGYLEPNPFQAPGGASRLAGGVVALAGTVERLRAEQPASIMVAAGDLIGASPLSSGLLHDQPTIEAVNRMGLALSAVGNHEFDYGRDELARLTKGGCPQQGCAPGDAPFVGAKYEYLAANVFDEKTGKHAFTPYRIEQVGAVRVAFVGAVLEGAPAIIIAKNIAGLSFRDEAESVNALVPEIVAQGVRAIVLLVHEGGVPKAEVDAATCGGVEGSIFPLMDKLDPEVDVVVSGHTHQAYVCRYKGRLVTQASSYGRRVTRIDLSIDPRPERPGRAGREPARRAGAAQRGSRLRRAGRGRQGAHRRDRRAPDRASRRRPDQAQPRRERRIAARPLRRRRAARVGTRGRRGDRLHERGRDPAGPAPGAAARPLAQLRRRPGRAPVRQSHDRARAHRRRDRGTAGVAARARRRRGLMVCSRGFTYRYDKHRPPGQRLLPANRSSTASRSSRNASIACWSTTTSPAAATG
jgi:hypothetical protein